MDRPLPRPTRRQALGTIGAGVAIGWAAPQIVSVSAAQAATLPPTLDLTAVAGRDSDFVVTTSDGRAFRSLDAGLNWTATPAPPPPPGTNLVVATNSGSTNDFVIATATGEVWFTINAAYTWNAPITPPSITGVVAAAGVDGYVVLVSSTGDVWWSDFDGETWQGAATPPSAIDLDPPITAVAAGAGMFIAVTSDGRVYSSPGGDVWTGTVAPGGPVPFASVACNGLDTCAVAGSSLVYRCEIDSPWSTIDTGVPDLVVVAADGQGDFIAVSSTGTVARSVDFGNDWTNPVAVPPTFTMSHVAGDRDGHYVGFGADGRVARSLDYGNTWQDPVTPPA